MPYYSPFGSGNALFGDRQDLFGNPPPGSDVQAPLTVTPVGYDSLQIDWSPSPAPLLLVSSTASSGSPVVNVTVASGTAGIGVGMRVTGTNIPLNTVVIAVGPTTFTMSQNTTGVVNGTLQLTTPNLGWVQQILVRSAYGIPTSVYDGVQLLVQPGATPGAFSAQWVDVGLRSGRFYYYALFVQVLEQATPQVTTGWVRAGLGQGLVITDWAFANQFQSWMPEWYLELDDQQGTTDQPAGPLRRLLGLIGYETDWTRTYIETLSTLSNVDIVAGSLLPYLGSNYGVVYEDELGMTRSRVLVKNAVSLYKHKGTPEGITAATSAFTGYPVEVTIGKNLEIQLDDAAFDRFTGHWLPNLANNNSSVYLVPLAGPPHTSYVPVPPQLTTDPTYAQGNVNGYLPANATNVMGITAGYATGGYNWGQAGTAAIEVANGAALNALNSTVVSIDQAGNTAIWDGTTWSYYPTTTTPTNPGYRFGAQICATGTSNQFLLFGGFNPSSGLVLNDTWTLTYSGSTWAWANVTPAIGNPIGRNNGVMFYSSDSSSVILFGGCAGTPASSSTWYYWNDIWQWNGSAWSALTVSGTAPSRRAAMAFANLPTSAGFTSSVGSHPISLCLIFGGCYGAGTVYSDSFELSYDTTASTWSWAPGSTFTSGISARYGASMTSFNNGTMASFPYTTGFCLFGGTSAGGTPLRDTYVASYSTKFVFQAISTTTPVGLTARSYAQITYDNTPTPGVILTVGQDASGTQLGDMWRLTWTGGTVGTNWTWAQVTPSVLPPGRSNHSVAWNSGGSGYMVLFGGNVTTPSYAANVGMYANGSDTWVWSGSAWTEVLAPTGPCANGRWGGTMVYDGTAGAQTVLLFGGFSTRAYLNDVWSWNGTAHTWTKLTTTGTAPSARAYVASCNVTAGNLFAGGLDASSVAQAGTWRLTYTAGPTWTWSNPVPTSPTARYGAAMAAISGTTAVLFGGKTTATPTLLNDTWTYSSGTWTNPTPAASPPARVWSSMAYDAASGSTVTILFGGSGATSLPNPTGLLNDTWQWNGTTWSVPTSLFGTPPSARYGDVVIYDTTLSAIVVLAGFTNVSSPHSGFLNDVWKLVLGAIPTKFSISTCTSATALTLGIPVTSTTTSVVLSAYVSAATATTATFAVQLDWYNINGSFISSSTGTPVADVYSSWTRAYVAAPPAVGAAFYGRTLISTSLLSADVHYVDAVQVELNTLTTPGPTSWEPPRDIKVNVLPVRQNLIPDPQGFGAVSGVPYGWTSPQGVSTIGVTTAAYDSLIGTSGSYLLGRGSTGTATVTSNKILVNPSTSVLAAPYTFSAYFKGVATSGAASTRSVQVGLTFYDSSNTVIGTAHSGTPVSEVANSWVRASVSYTAPTNAASVAVTLNVIAVGTGGTENHYATGVMLEPSSFVNSYFDANPQFNQNTLYGNDFAFEGTPNRSVSDYYPSLLPKLRRLYEMLPDYTPIGSTYSLDIGTTAWANVGLNG